MIRSRLTTVTVATLGAGAVHLLAVTAGVDVTVPEGPGATTRTTLTLGAVVATAVVASLAGWGSLALLERVTTRARTAWTVLAVVVLALSLPYLPGFSPAERVVLTLSHLAVGVPLIVGLRRTARSAEHGLDDVADDPTTGTVLDEEAAA